MGKMKTHRASAKEIQENRLRKDKKIHSIQRAFNWKENS